MLAPVSAEHETLVREAAEALVADLSRGYERADAIRLTNMLRSMSKYSDTTLRKIATLSMGRYRYDVVEELIIQCEPESVLSDYLHLAGCLEAYSDGYEDELLPRLHAFGCYEGLFPQGNRYEYPQERLAQCEAIISIIPYLVKSVLNFTLEESALDYVPNRQVDGMMIIIGDERLRALITDTRHDPALIAKIIQERCTANVDDIIALMDCDAPALVEGVL